METQIIYALKEADLLEKFDTKVRCAVKDGLSELGMKQSKSARINYITRKEVCEMLHISYPIFTPTYQSRNTALFENRATITI